MMTERLTELVEEFKVKNNNFKIVRIKESRVIDEDLITRLGVEFTGYLSAIKGDELYDPDFSDPDSKYCVDFSNVEYYASAALQKLITMDKSHMRLHNRKGISISNLRPEISEVFRITRLHKVFDVHDNNGKYKDAMRDFYG